MQRLVTPATKNQEATVYVGNMDERVNEALLWELMVQVGPVVHVHIPRDRITQQHQSYGFIEFRSPDDAEYASKVMNQVKLYGKPLRVNKATADKRSADVGANLFIGNLAAEVDEKIMTDTFGTFGTVIDAKVARDLETGLAKGYGFVNFDNFDSADAAIESMNGQFLCNKPITVTFAFKKDGKGERHGTAAERLLALQAKKAGISVADAIAANEKAAATAAASGANPYAILQPGQQYPQAMPPAQPGMMYPPQMPMGYYQPQDMNAAAMMGMGQPAYGYQYPPGYYPSPMQPGYYPPGAYTPQAPQGGYPPPPQQQPPPRS